MHLRPDLVSPGTVSTLQSVADRDALVAPVMLSKGVGGTDVSYLHPLRRPSCRITRCVAAALAGTVASGAPIVGDDMACPGLDRWPFPC